MAGDNAFVNKLIATSVVVVERFVCTRTCSIEFSHRGRKPHPHSSELLDILSKPATILALILSHETRAVILRNRHLLLKTPLSLLAQTTIRMPSPAISRLDQGISAPPTAASRTISNSAVEAAPGPKLTGVEASKQLAAWTAVDQHIKPEHKVCVYSNLNAQPLLSVY